MNQINFNEETHTYTLGDKVLTSVTTLLRLAGISPDYSCVNETLLRKSAERGSFIHKELEEYIKFNKEGLTDVPRQFQKWLNENDLIVIGSEVIVFDENFAGTIDLIVQNTKTHEYQVWDFKTTSTIHRNSVSWQTSIYALLWELQTGNKVSKVGAIHIKDNNFKPIELLRKTDEQVWELFEWKLFGNDKSFVQENDDNAELGELEEIEKEIAFYENRIKDLKELKNGMIQTLTQILDRDNVDSMENSKIKFTRVRGGTRKTFDATTFKKENKELYDKYLISKEYETSYRVTLKKGTQND